MYVSNSYQELSSDLYSESMPTPVVNPQLVVWNKELGEELKLPEEVQNSSSIQAQIFSGNQLLPGSKPLALAYAGHQFGHFSPQLGDGRAHLLGQISSHDGRKLDLQLKGSGPTVFSRRGDGRCALKPALREFLMSEAIHALGINTARSLAVVSTGELVQREQPLPGAVVTRLASSHLRVGTFEYAAALGRHDLLKELLQLAIQRHFPEFADLEDVQEQAQALLNAVIGKQIELVCSWLRVGFIHGVMNTDNCTISGETIDYGPCAMMGVYDPETCFSYIDRQGRYAFGNQQYAIHWNMAKFASALLPLIDKDSQVALRKAESIITHFPEKFAQNWRQVAGNKLGLVSPLESDDRLIADWFNHLQQQRLDYTNSFASLQAMLSDFQPLAWKDAPIDWIQLWQKRLQEQNCSTKEISQLLTQQNPLTVPRNHLVEKVLDEAVESDSVAELIDFLAVLKTPYEKAKDTKWTQVSPDEDRNYQTFCGT